MIAFIHPIRKEPLKGSTTQATHLRNKAIAAAKKAKFNADHNAREEQIGVMVFNFKLN